MGRKSNILITLALLVGGVIAGCSEKEPEATTYPTPPPGQGQAVGGQHSAPPNLDAAKRPGAK